MRRILNLLIALDQFLFCVATLGDSAPDETASAAAWRLETQGRWQGKVFRPLIDFIFSPFQSHHCVLAYQAEIDRTQAGER